MISMDLRRAASPLGTGLALRWSIKRAPTTKRSSWRHQRSRNSRRRGRGSAAAGLGASLPAQSSVGLPGTAPEARARPRGSGCRFPFYYEIKMAFVVWLLSPYTRGASLLYRKFVHPTLSSKEKEIDHFILQAKERGYKTLVSFGKKSINVAAAAAVQVAAKSQGALAGRLHSFSNQDLRFISETATVHYSGPLYLEEQEVCRRPIGRRPVMQPLGSDSNEENYWSDSELSATSGGCCQDLPLPKPLARSQSLRQVKKKPPAKEGSTRGVRSRLRKKTPDQDS
ncbi:receptor expression-enhancing protein 4 [Python bivittatus]|uniref:Receptor expression-enhancing protein n=1 Tax=Python bivittatus TaxID=176946 RepID=A0A9F5IZA7_PYTBI|nr:receptor expression-enhancing protein 4 [Python bivittatus]